MLDAIKHITDDTFSFMKTAHRCIVCVTQSNWVKYVIFVFSRFPGSAEAHVTSGGTVKRLLIAYFMGNISAKKYQNPFMCVKVIASQRWDVFLRHGVDMMLTSIECFVSLSECQTGRVRSVVRIPLEPLCDPVDCTRSVWERERSRWRSRSLPVVGRALAIRRTTKVCGERRASVDECFMNAAPSASSVSANCLLHLSLQLLLLPKPFLARPASLNVGYTVKF